MNMIEYNQLIAKLISIRSDLTERVIVDEIQKIASESIYSTHDILRWCINLAKEGKLMSWEEKK